MTHLIRTFSLILIFGVLGTPLPAQAQPPRKVPRLGVLGNSQTGQASLFEAFRKGLRDLGWIEGQNILVDYRWAEGHSDRFPALAAELLALHPDVIFAPSSIYVAAVKPLTATIPVVFSTHADPIGSGDIVSLAHPGGNITGIAQMQTQVNTKALELLKETLPKLSQVAVLWDPATPSHRPGLKAVEDAAQGLQVQLRPVGVQRGEDLESTFASLGRERAGALLVFNSTVFFSERHRIADLALKHRLPTASVPREYADAGCLLSYGANLPELFRQAATYVDKILKGAMPADLPVQQATTFEFVINLKTAKALGLTIPRSVLDRADEVIQ